MSEDTTLDNKIKIKPCNDTWQAVGPFNQTIFLGCSVESYSMNLGWAGESSTCKVKLVQDYEKHWRHDQDAFDQLLDTTINNQKKKKSDAFDNADLDREDPLGQGTTRNLLAKHKKLWKKIDDDYVKKGITDVNYKDDGKKCYATFSNGGTTNLKASDPGFIGDPARCDIPLDLDIIGTPVRFAFGKQHSGAELSSFVGILKNWKYSEGVYDIEIGSMASTLKGVQLILNKYGGNISTEIGPPGSAESQGIFTGDPSDLPLTNGIQGNVAVPTHDITLATDQTRSDYNVNAWKKDIAAGNIPNLINIFGYLENKGFGTSMVDPERGIPANVVYDAIIELLSNRKLENPVKYPSDSLLRNENQFSPYGAIVTKSPFRRSPTKRLTVGSRGWKVNNCNFGPIAVNSASFHNDQTNESIFLDRLGICRTKTAVDNVNRPLFRIDIRNVPRPPNNIYISKESISLLDFIDYCCTNGGVDFLVRAETDIDTSNYTGVIVIDTVSRTVQPVPNAIKQFITNFDDQDKIIDYTYGEEFNDDKTRTVVVGGPQERYHQIAANTYGRLQHLRVFNPVLKRFVSNKEISAQKQFDGNINQIVRMPNYNNPKREQWRKQAFGVTAQQDTTQDFWNTQEGAWSGMKFRRGSYYTLAKPSLSGDNNQIPSYPLWKDLISPYYGLDAFNNVRLTYYDKKRRMVQITMNFYDIYPFFPTVYDINGPQWSNHATWILKYYPEVLNPLSYDPARGNPGANVFGQPTGGQVGYGYFIVDEDELRCAITSYDSWWGYTFARMQYNYPTSIGRIVYDYIVTVHSKSYAQALMLANQSPQKLDYQGYLQLMAQLGLGGIPRGINGRPLFTSENHNAFSAGIDNMLKGIHGRLQQIGKAYHGKSFQIRMPNQYGYNAGGGRTVTNWEIAGSAWEPDGNFIDDNIEVGSPITSQFKDPTGKIMPLLGFDNTAEYWPPTFETNRGLFDQMNFSERRSAILNAPNAGMWYFPLVHNLPENTYFSMPYAAFYGTPLPLGFSDLDWVSNPFPNTKTSLGFTPTNEKRWKVYVKANIPAENPTDSQNPQVLWVFGLPRIVMSCPSPVYVRVGDEVVDHIHDIFVYAALGDEKPFDRNAVVPTLPGANPINSNYSDMLIAYLYNDILAANNIGDNIDEFGRATIQQIGIHDAENPDVGRAACPIFAGIPIRNNLMSYGPWVNHPGVNVQYLLSFAGQPNTQPSAADQRNAVNNLVGGVNFKYDEELVPWEWGGMENLDIAGCIQAGADNNAQQTLEYGTITLAGIMLNNSNIGSRLLSGDYAPILSSVSVSFGDNGINTRYEMRTFTRKLGFYNKEYAENMQRYARESLAAQNRIARANANLYRKQLSLLKPNSISMMR